MKAIRKGTEPTGFAAWKALANEDWSPCWENLQNPEKSELKNALARDQGWICCYCERSLDMTSSDVEHIIPRSKKPVVPDRDLDYDNLLCSCNSNDNPAYPPFCNNLRGDWYDANYISPLDPGCEGRFRFTANGKTAPNSAADAAAKETIKRLGLDIELLNSMRKAAIEPFLDETLSREELSLFVASYLSLTAEGRFNPFHTTIAFLHRHGFL